MAQVNIYLDDELIEILKNDAKKSDLSLSKYLGRLIQRAIILDENGKGLDSILERDKFLNAFQKHIKLTAEMLPLMRYLVKNLHLETTEEHSQKYLSEAKTYAEGIVNALF